MVGGQKFKILLVYRNSILGRMPKCQMMNKNTFQKGRGPRGKAPFNKASCVNNLTNPQNRCIFRGTAGLGAAMNVTPLAHSD